jgi:hypothetical protein
MAKKAVRKLEEDDEYRNFEFPTFDEGKFLSHEFEQTYATVLAFVFALVIGVVSFAVSRTALGGLAGFGAGIVLIVASPYLVQRLRPSSTEYTRGEWAALLLLEIFGWLGVWFLVTDLLR